MNEAGGKKTKERERERERETDRQTDRQTEGGREGRERQRQRQRESNVKLFWSLHAKLTEMRRGFESAEKRSCRDDEYT